MKEKKNRCIQMPVFDKKKHFDFSIKKTGFSLRHLCLPGTFKVAKHLELSRYLDSVLACQHVTCLLISPNSVIRSKPWRITEIPLGKLPLPHLPFLLSTQKLYARTNS